MPAQHTTTQQQEQEEKNRDQNVEGSHARHPSRTPIEDEVKNTNIPGTCSSIRKLLRNAWGRIDMPPIPKQDHENKALNTCCNSLRLEPLRLTLKG